MEGQSDSWGSCTGPYGGWILPKDVEIREVVLLKSAVFVCTLRRARSTPRRARGTPRRARQVVVEKLERGNPYILPPCCFAQGIWNEHVVESMLWHILLNALQSADASWKVENNSSSEHWVWRCRKVEEVKVVGIHTVSRI